MQLRKIRLNVSKHLSGRGLKLFMGQCLIPASIVGEPALQCKVLVQRYCLCFKSWKSLVEEKDFIMCQK